jgi:hypothetical protein
MEILRQLIDNSQAAKMPRLQRNGVTRRWNVVCLSSVPSRAARVV